LTTKINATLAGCTYRNLRKATGKDPLRSGEYKLLRKGQD